VNINGKSYRTVWVEPAGEKEHLKIIDQRRLPFSFEIEELGSVDDVAVAIADMHVRGAGCIGATAGYGVWLAARESGGDREKLEMLCRQLLATRPTASNLSWAVNRQLSAIEGKPASRWVEITLREAGNIADEDCKWCQSIGRHGLTLIEEIAAGKPANEPVNILTHCNAGWLAFTDWGSATSPIYAAHRAGIAVHVWVDETRPRNQGARLTSWELANEGVPHTVIVDNVGGHLMQHSMVDLVITGADRVTGGGDVCNKIGTYLKALAAKDNNVPFYVAFPSSTLDWDINEGVGNIPIEERGSDEVSHIEGVLASGELAEVSLLEARTASANYAFDVSPARLITGLITERGICSASGEALRELFPGHG
jgi:methylthioribose-1-phosphate isomerase